MGESKRASSALHPYTAAKTLDGAPVAARAHNIQHARPRVHAHSAAPHRARQARYLGSRLALGSQQHQKGGCLGDVGCGQQRLRNGG